MKIFKRLKEKYNNIYIVRFIKFVYSNYKILKYENKIRVYSQKINKLRSALNMGFDSEKDFYNKIQEKWNKVKPIEPITKKVDEGAKKRLQTLAGIDTNSKSKDKVKKDDLEFNDTGASAVLSIMAEKE